VPFISFSGRTGDAGKRTASTSPSLVARAPEAWNRHPRSVESPWEETALSIRNVALTGAQETGW
jgi:hypothetical protein